MSRSFGYAPRLLTASAAAHYCGISESKLRGIGIPRKVVGGNKLYDIRDLDVWIDNLAYDGEDKCNEENPADLVFGVAA